MKFHGKNWVLEALPDMFCPICRRSPQRTHLCRAIGCEVHVSQLPSAAVEGGDLLGGFRIIYIM